MAAPMAINPGDRDCNIHQKNLKPLINVGDKVYAAWWPDKKRKRKATWWRGVIASCDDMECDDNEYGPTRFYEVQFDDGDKLDGVADCFVLPENEFLLTTRNGGETKWIGVDRIFDANSSDHWAKVVGWYTANIDGRVQTFSLLSEALRAYDSFVVKCKGPRKIREADLNLPEEWPWLFSTLKPEGGNGGDNVKREESQIISPSPLPGKPAQGNCSAGKSGCPSHLETAGSYESPHGHGNNGNEPSESSKPQPKTKKSFKSKYTGVAKRDQGYSAGIYHHKKQRYLGYFKLEANAALAYDEAARLLKGPDWNTNFTSIKQYENARTRSMEETMCSNADMGTSSGAASMVKDRVSKFCLTLKSDMPQAEGKVTKSKKKKSATVNDRVPLASSNEVVTPRIARARDGNSGNEVFGTEKTGLTSVSAGKKESGHTEVVSPPGDSSNSHLPSPDDALNSGLFPAKNEPSDEKRMQPRPLRDRGGSNPSTEMVKSSQPEVVSANKTRPQHKNKSSDYCGVSYKKSTGKYVSQIGRGGKLHFLGIYMLATDGAFAYDEAARFSNGAGCKINFVTMKDYEDARTRELEERGLSSNDVGLGVVSAIKVRVSKLSFATNKAADPKRGKYDADSNINSEAEKADSSKLMLNNDVSSLNQIQPRENHTCSDSKASIQSSARKSDTESNPKEVDRDHSVGILCKMGTYQIAKDAKLMQLTAEQMNDMPFPLGCPVLHHNKQTDSVIGPNNHDVFHSGVVTSSFMDLKSREIVYEVMPARTSDSTKSLMLGSELVFGLNCPVYVSPTRGHEAHPLQGRILLCKTSSLSTIMIQKEGNPGQFQVMKDIPLDRLNYRKDIETEEPALTTHVTASAQGYRENDDVRDEGPSAQQPHAKEPSTSGHAPKMITSRDTDAGSQMIGQEFHSSNSTISSGKVTTKKSFIANINPMENVPTHNQPHPSHKPLPEENRLKSISSSVEWASSKYDRDPEYDRLAASAVHARNGPRSIRKRPYLDSFIASSDLRPATRRAKVGSSSVDSNIKHYCRVHFPHWLVNDSASKDRLHYHFLSKGYANQTNLRIIGNDTNCTLEIIKDSAHGNWKSIEKHHFNDPSHIYIEAKKSSPSPKESIKLAKEKLEHSLLEYIHHDDSSGRLFYDLAKSCKYLHAQSSSTAVAQRNPFWTSEMGWLDIVELPYHKNHISGQKIYHGHHIFSKSWVLSRIHCETDCLIKVCGSSFDLPFEGERLLCEPYISVFGKHSGHVDRAVLMLKDEIRNHTMECNCVWKD